MRAAAPFVCLAFVAACRVATQQNELHVGDDHVDSAPLTAPEPEADAGAPPVDAGIDRDVDATSDADVDADAAPSSPPPCAQVTMNANAPTTNCAPSSYAVSGGTITAGGYTLSRWSDDQKSCFNTASQRQGTMVIENVGDKLFMRWTLFVDGKPSWGTYELTSLSPTAVMRSEVCNWSPQTPAQTVSFTATSNEIFFVHLKGQERWTRIPRALPNDAPAVDPVFN